MNREPTPREADLLRWLQQPLPLGATQHTAAEVLGVSVHRIGNLVSGLRDKGYVGRRWYTLTSKGLGWTPRQESLL